jgi:hypothetical protein
MRGDVYCAIRRERFHFRPDGPSFAGYKLEKPGLLPVSEKDEEIMRRPNSSLIKLNKMEKGSDTMARLVTGLFKNRMTAETAVRELSQWGYTRDDIGVVMSDSTRSKEFGIEAGSKVAQGASVGGAVGGAVGAALAAIAAIGTSIAVPGLGLVIAGPIAAALAGAGAGGAAGGLIGLLVGAGIPEHRAKIYDAGLREGGILLGVQAKSDEDADRIEKVFENLNAQKVRQK